MKTEIKGFGPRRRYVYSFEEGQRVCLKRFAKRPGHTVYVVGKKVGETKAGNPVYNCTRVSPHSAYPTSISAADLVEEPT